MIKLKKITKEINVSSGLSSTILKEITFDIEDNKFSSLLAPSGSGKSLLLKIISGLTEQTSGEIDNPSKQKIIFIPSAPSSYPWLNVFQNVNLGQKKMDYGKIQEIINLVGLEGYDTFHCNNKSLGFRFRISLARSLAYNPSAILLDDPFSKMDPKTKSELLFLVRDINKKLGITFLFATSNVTDAIFLSDRIHLMKKDPGELISEFEINLPAERNDAIFEEDAFIKFRDNIIARFKTIESPNLTSLPV